MNGCISETLDQHATHALQRLGYDSILSSIDLIELPWRVTVVPGLILTLYLPRHLCTHQGVFQSFCIISMVAYLMQWYFINFQLSRGAKQSFGSISSNYLAKWQFGHFLCLLFIIFFPFISFSFLLTNGCHLPLKFSKFTRHRSPVKRHPNPAICCSHHRYTSLFKLLLQMCCSSSNFMDKNLDLNLLDLLVFLCFWCLNQSHELPYLYALFCHQNLLNWC